MAVFAFHKLGMFRLVGDDGDDDDGGIDNADINNEAMILHTQNSKVLPKSLMLITLHLFPSLLQLIIFRTPRTPRTPRTAHPSPFQ